MVSRDSEAYNTAKYRVKISHFTEQGYDIKGVIHVGAHDGEEVQYYQQLGIENILCFEPLWEIVPEFQKRYPNVPIFPIALGRINKLSVFYRTNDGRQGQASSLYKPLREEFAMTGGIRNRLHVPVLRFDTFLAEHPEIDLSNYDCLVIDVQGAELDVLKGFGALLPQLSYFNIECSQLPSYKNGATAQEVVSYLGKHRIIQDSPIVSHDDVFFINSEVKPKSDMIYRGLA